MKKSPHYLLLADASPDNESLHSGGTWRFILERLGGDDRIEVDEYEPGVVGERLQLLAIVRGLEALEQPSHVTLVTPCKYVERGIRSYLTAWRENGWQWERYGAMSPVKNRDLWCRIDRAMQFHTLQCRIWRFDRAHRREKQPELSAEAAHPGGQVERLCKHDRLPGRRRGQVAVAARRGWNRVVAAAANRVLNIRIGATA